MLEKDPRTRYIVQATMCYWDGDHYKSVDCGTHGVYANSPQEAEQMVKKQVGKARNPNVIHDDGRGYWQFKVNEA